MIQRIQTLFLLIALVASAFFIDADLWTGSFTGADGVTTVNLTTKSVSENSARSGGEVTDSLIDFLLYFNVLALIIILISAFMFKQRLRQVGVVVLAAILELIIAGLSGYLIFKYRGNYVGSLAESWGWGILFPLASFVALILATRFIMKDHNKVRNINRFR